VQTYVLRRILINIPVIFMVATLVYFATSVLPGDFAAQRIAAQNPIETTDLAVREAQIEKIKDDLGLSGPVWKRYLTYIGNMTRGDFGESFQTREPALSGFAAGLPYTLQLSIMTLLIGIAVALPVGIISAIRQDTWLDYVLRFFAMFSLGAPNFWVATMLLLYVVRFRLWTIDLTGHPLLWEDPVASMKLFVIPAVAGGVASAAGTMRLLRSQMLEVLREDYVRTAWAKGLRERQVVMRHALKPALIPVVTSFGLAIATLIAGNVVFESIFGIPGVGFRILAAIRARDIPVVQAFVVILATTVVFTNLAVDVLYGYLDPRIRLS